jgi:transcriptional regulator with XRE-family HTH domain
MAESVPASSPDRQRRRRSATDRVGGRVASYRNERGLKVSELARLVGVSPSLISQIERGQSQPSVSTLFALAESLEVPVDAFFAEHDPNGPALAQVMEERADRLAGADENGPRPGADVRYVVRRADRAAIDIEGGVRWERLTPETLPNVDFLELVYAPGSESHPELYRHPGSEMVLVLSGRLDITVGFERYELHAGDSIHFPSTFPHRYVNPSDSEEARAVTVILHDGERNPAPGAEQRRP